MVLDHCRSSLTLVSTKLFHINHEVKISPCKTTSDIGHIYPTAKPKANGEYMAPTSSLFKRDLFFSTWNIKGGVCYFEFFKGGFRSKAMLYSRMIILRENLSNLCHKNSKVSFSHSDRISWASPVDSHQSLGIKMTTLHPEILSW